MTAVSCRTGMTGSRVVLALVTVACASGETSQLPYRTLMTSAGDTTIARTVGDVPDSLVRSLTMEWQSASNPDDSTTTIGDIREIAVARDGRLFIWDNATPALWAMDAAGRSARRISRAGGGPGEYGHVNGIAIRSDGRLVVWDQGNVRLNVYDADGAFLSSSTVPFSFCCPGGRVSADTRNQTWLRAVLFDFNKKGKARAPGVDKEIRAFYRFDSSGTLVDTVLIAKLSGDHPALTAINATRTGISMSSRSMPYGTGTMVAVTPAGQLIYGQGRPYVLYAESNGKPLRIEREAPAVPVSDDERSQIRTQIEFDMHRNVPSWTWDGPPVPSDKPFYSEITVADDGRLWVALSMPSEKFEPDPPSSTQPNPRPRVTYRSREQRWDVFEPDGRYLGQVRAPRLFEAYVMRGDTIWGTLRDENDLPAVVKMRLDRPFQGNR